MGLARFRPAGRTFRALVAVAVVGILVVSLLTVRGKLDEEEKRAAYVMSSLSWKVSEALLESQKLVTALSAFENGAATREDVIIAAELLWSRSDVLMQSEFSRHDGLTKAGEAIGAYLESNETAIYDAPDFTNETAAALRKEIAGLARNLRAIWIRDFLGNRQRIHATATQDIADARLLFERLIMACVVLLALYMIAEIRGAQRAQSRERVLRDQAQTASEAKTRFLANVSHEIRTPLNGVIGMAQELAETKQSGDQRQMTAVILSSAELLLGTINDVLDISKIESGKLTLEELAFDSAERVRLSTALYRPMLQDKGVALIVDLEQSPETHVVGDPLRFMQVVNNLVSNAAKFTENGHVRVALAYEPTADKGGVDLTVTVEDTGPGIPISAKAEIFQPFGQADSSTTRTQGGTGLGLTISRAICLEMGGDIELWTEPGKGSRFTARFRMRHATSSDQVANVAEARSVSAKRPVSLDIAANLSPENSPATEIVFHKETGRDDQLSILLVDDSATNRLVMKRLLKSLDAVIEEADSGFSAVERAREKMFDLILMDIQMPGMDGVEATNEIRAIEAMHAPGRRVPIVAVTANVLSHQIDSYLENGMDKVVAKPVRKAEILDVIGTLQEPRVN